MTRSIRYYSTNHNSKPVTFREALLQGQAPDKGLYMSDNIPKISSEEISSMEDLSYPDIAFSVANKFLNGEIPEDELRKITKEAYNFEVPLEVVDDDKYIMRLDQGPTASFKDFAARMMGRLMDYYAKNESKELTILTATSGDTGSAVANAFYGLEGIKMVVLFPGDEVSDMQRKQMTTLGGNITAVAVDGKFDDCQAMVKEAFSDPYLKDFNFSSANSINFGRVIPQTVYYFYAHSRLCEVEEDILLSIPFGNGGNQTGGLIAKKIGLPVKKFIAATNENDEFPKFLESGKYVPIKPSKACLSNAMNVGHPSNLARMVDLYEGQMDEKGKINKQPNMDLMRKDLFSTSVSDQATKNTIKEANETYGIILEPHGAVGWAGLERYLSQVKGEMGTPTVAVSLETAHPAKFPEVIKEVLGISPKLPESMRDLETKKEKVENISAYYEDFKKYLKNIL